MASSPWLDSAPGTAYNHSHLSPRGPGGAGAPMSPEGGEEAQPPNRRQSRSSEMVRRPKGAKRPNRPTGVNHVQARWSDARRGRRGPTAQPASITFNRDGQTPEGGEEAQPPNRGQSRSTEMVRRPKGAKRPNRDPMSSTFNRDKRRVHMTLT